MLQRDFASIESSRTSGRGAARCLALPALAFVLLSTGCSHSVVFSTTYLAGVELTPGENGQQRAKVALQKFEGVAMPGCADETTLDNWLQPCETVLPEAYSALAYSDLNTGTLLLGALTDVQIVQVFATGEAATKAVESGGAKAAFLTIEATYDDSLSTRCIENWLDAHDSHPKELADWWKAKGLDGAAVLLIAGQGYDERRDELIREKGITCQ